ncbi:hypothetical protein OF83DRAFT_1158303 [Amylostereum chailletii]|nr:hypothetical protein OF83DRAFT_1158303 [Amylostereum chailletii]
MDPAAALLHPDVALRSLPCSCCFRCSSRTARENTADAVVACDARTHTVRRVTRCGRSGREGAADAKMRLCRALCHRRGWGRADGCMRVAMGRAHLLARRPCAALVAVCAVFRVARALKICVTDRCPFRRPARRRSPFPSIRLSPAERGTVSLTSRGRWRLSMAGDACTRGNGGRQPTGFERCTGGTAFGRYAVFRRFRGLCVDDSVGEDGGEERRDRRRILADLCAPRAMRTRICSPGADSAMGRTGRDSALEGRTDGRRWLAERMGDISARLDGGRTEGHAPGGRTERECERSGP